ncbi:MAG: HAD-IC family P-type ATPase [Clostridia bacterium]|nr:HAD-IC family P-type ATPase [Clostridia bacterium]
MNNYPAQTQPIGGLTSAEVEARFAAGRSNKPVEPPSKTVRQIILSNLLTYFNLIFFIIAFALIIFGRFTDLTFLFVIVINTVIGIFQEIKSKNTLDRLSLLTAPTATVLRDGVLHKIPVDELVIDDTVLLSAGSQISADAVVIEGEISANEALVTGESDEISKKTGDPLLSGSFVVSGKCYARLTAVGADSFVSKLTLDAKKMKKKTKSAGMMRSLTRLVQVIGIIIIPIAVFMMITAIRAGETWGDAVSSTAGALIGMIPEGLYLLVSVALAVSVMRLAKKRTLVHELGCIETLARVDVLCVDKTGTITDSKMRVLDVMPISAGTSVGEMEKALSALISNLDPDNDTMRALSERFGRSDFQKADKIVPFSSKYKYSAAAIGRTGYVIGAPEFILGRRFSEIEALVNEQTAGGCRVLLFASYDSVLEGTSLDCNYVNPIGIVKLVNPVRENAPRTFRYFAEQGVSVKVISGDNPRTASEAAMAADIPDADRYVDLSSLKFDREVEQAALKYTVFGRVTPDRKRILVRALKNAGHTVAMTGDGVNDVLALKEADCSIAMASGSDVAAQVSNLVLLNSDFAALPSVVDEGRRVINNIERSASLFLVKNIFSLVFAVISILANFTYPISPANLTLVNLVTIGIPSFVLALEPNHSPVTGKFLRNVLYRAFPAGLGDIFMLIGVTMFKIAFDIPDAETSTVCIVLIGFIGLIMLYFVCRPFNPLRVTIMISMPTLFLIGLFCIPEFFSVSALSFGSSLVLGVFMLLALPVMFVNRWIFEQASLLWKKITGRHVHLHPETGLPIDD